MNSMLTTKDLRIALKQGPDLGYLLYLHVDGVSVDIEQDVERIRLSQPLLFTLSFHGVLSAFGRHPLQGVRCLLFFDDRDWWSKAKERAGLTMDCQALGKLACLPQSPSEARFPAASIEVGIAVTRAQLNDLRDATNALLAQSASVSIRIELDLTMPERDPVGDELNWLWVRAVAIEAYSALSAPARSLAPEGDGGLTTGSS